MGVCAKVGKKELSTKAHNSHSVQSPEEQVQKGRPLKWPRTKTRHLFGLLGLVADGQPGGTISILC